MPTEKMERWTCDRCGVATYVPEVVEINKAYYSTPAGWMFVDASPVFEGPLCPDCLAALRSWMGAAKPAGAKET